MSDYKITGCQDCPFLSVAPVIGYFCNHPTVIGTGDNFLDTNDSIDPITPDWCPLKKEPITIYISNEQTK